LGGLQQLPIVGSLKGATADQWNDTLFGKGGQIEMDGLYSDAAPFDATAAFANLTKITKIR
jgi:hypothetical protein